MNTCMIESPSIEQIKNDYNQRIYHNITMCMNESGFIDTEQAKTSILCLWFHVFLPRHSHLDESAIDDVKSMFTCILNTLEFFQQLGTGFDLTRQLFTKYILLTLTKYK